MKVNWTEKKELQKNTLILGIGKLLPKLVSFITLPIITAKLTKAEYGTYDFILTLVTFLLPIATLQIQSAAFRFLIDYRDDVSAKKRIITNICMITFPISIAFSIGLLFFWSDLSALTRVFISLYFIADISFITFSQISRGLSFNKDYSISSIILSIINAGGIVFALNFNNYGITGLILAMVIANFVAVLYLIIKNHLFSYFIFKEISFEQMKELVKYSWPMIPNNLSGWVLNLSDRLVITNVLGAAMNGVYAVANKIPNILSIAQNIFVMAWQENASISVKDKNVDKYYSEMLNNVLNVMMSITALLIGCTPLIFRILIRGDYADAYYQMPILILGMFFNCMSSFLGGIYIAHKKTVNLGVSTFLAAVLNLMIDVVFINMIGITAGSLSTLVSYLVLYIYRLIDVKKFQKIHYNLKKQAGYILFIIGMLLLNALNNLYTNILNFLLGGVLFIIFNKKLIDKYLKKFLKKEDNV